MTSGLDYLLVALDGGTKETYESIRLKGDFDMLIKKIKMLLRLKKELGSKTRIQLQMIVMPKNESEIEQFKALFTEQERREIFQLRFKPLYETYAGTKEGIKHTKSCYWLWNMMSIAWNGEVQLCCMDYEASCLKTNVREHTVAEVWNSVKISEYRDKHRDMDYKSMPICDNCDIPEHGYFTNTAILSSVFFSANQIRQIMPIYEKYLMFRKKKQALSA